MDASQCQSRPHHCVDVVASGECVRRITTKTSEIVSLHPSEYSYLPITIPLRASRVAVRIGSEFTHPQCRLWFSISYIQFRWLAIPCFSHECVLKTVCSCLWLPILPSSTYPPVNETAYRSTEFRSLLRVFLHFYVFSF